MARAPARDKRGANQSDRASASPGATEKDDWNVVVKGSGNVSERLKGMVKPGATNSKDSGDKCIKESENDSNGHKKSADDSESDSNSAGDSGKNKN
ncbi:MAG: hypothetical protein WBF22_09235 [Methylocella sp.]